MIKGLEQMSNEGELRELGLLSLEMLGRSKGWLLPAGWGIQGDSQQGRGVASQGPVPQYPSKVSRADPEIMAGFKQELPGRFTVMRQVWGEAGKPIHRWINKVRDWAQEQRW